MSGRDGSAPAGTGPGASGPGASIELPDADATRAYGRALAALLRAGDLVVLTGPLGAGKTTLTQGIGEGLGVRGQVASPTFIIARVHPGPVDLVHVDAYRLGSLDELEALDLDTSLADSVTVVEWGEGLAEVLSEDRLEVRLDRPHGARPDEDLTEAEVGVRRVAVTGVGPRWAGVALPG